MDGVIFSETMTSGAVPQAVGVGTLYCAHAKANHVSPAPHPLGVREAILRGCVSVDAANSTASGGTNRCCAAGTEVSCCPSACTWDDDCDGKLGAGRLDAYRTLTLWGRCDRDTTLKGDVYVSGDVIFTGGATVTIQGGATIHVMPEDITYVDQWQPALWYDPDGEDDGDCMLDDQDAGEEAKIEIVFDNVTLNITGGDFVPVRITSFASAETDTDWCRVVISSGATVTGLNDRSLLVSGATHGIVDER